MSQPEPSIIFTAPAFEVIKSDSDTVTKVTFTSGGQSVNSDYSSTTTLSQSIKLQYCIVETYDYPYSIINIGSEITGLTLDDLNVSSITERDSLSADVSSYIYPYPGVKVYTDGGVYLGGIMSASYTLNSLSTGTNSNLEAYSYVTDEDFDSYFDTYDDDTETDQFGIYCLLKGTPVLTNKGYKPIEFIKKDAIILNMDKKERTVRNIVKQVVKVDKSDENRDLFKDKYRLKEEKSLIVTGGHMVKLGDEYHLPINSSRFENIQKDKSVNEFYHLELDEYDYFIAAGIPVESLCTEENTQQKIDYYKERGLEYQDLISSKK